MKLEEFIDRVSKMNIYELIDEMRNEVWIEGDKLKVRIKIEGYQEEILTIPLTQEELFTVQKAMGEIKKIRGT